MNAARDRHSADLALKLAEKTTEELQQMLLARDPARPSRYLLPAAMRRAAEHVLTVRRMCDERSATANGA